MWTSYSICLQAFVPTPFPVFSTRFLYIRLSTFIRSLISSDFSRSSYLSILLYFFVSAQFKFSLGSLILLPFGPDEKGQVLEFPSAWKPLLVALRWIAGEKSLMFNDRLLDRLQEVSFSACSHLQKQSPVLVMSQVIHFSLLFKAVF